VTLFARWYLQVVVFWVMTPCSDVVGYHRFGGPCCLHLQGEVSGAWIEIQVVVFWVMTLCSNVLGYQRFGGPCTLHLQGIVTGAWTEIQVEFFWVVLSCSDMVRQQRFWSPCRFHLHPGDSGSKVVQNPTAVLDVLQPRWPWLEISSL
jgi:hypothetical protein